MQQSPQRSTFQTSRLLEFFSEKELQMQIGFAKPQWPIALLKELIDNALDACESAGVPPDIEVTVEPDRVSIRDHGPGLPVKILKQSLNYLVRVSDKAHYVSPSRGQLGNALKCLWAAPYVAHGEDGYVEVVTRGTRYQIAVSLDRIAQRPELRLMPAPDGFVKNGTLITMVWPRDSKACWPRAMMQLFTNRPLTSCWTMPHSIRMRPSPTATRKPRSPSRAPPQTGTNGAHRTPRPHIGTASSACGD